MHHSSNNLNNYLSNYLCNNSSRRINNIHFVGIGGTGMSGIAEVLHNLGFTITGSDLLKNEATNRLVNLGIQIAYSHIADNVAYCDAIVASTAVAYDNIELVVARQRRIPIIHRSEMLAELMRFKYGVAVAGSHGKTTTTSLIATILAEAKCDPTFVVGGKLNKFSANAKLGTGEFFVAEADESDGSFLKLNPLLAVITNIDNDHLSNYDGKFDNLKKAFLEFIHRLPFYGLVVVCKDDPIIYSMLGSISRPLLSYGFSAQSDVRALDYKQKEHVSVFQVELPGETNARKITLNLPGKHNVLNALAAIAVARELNIDFEVISHALMNFHGTDRRFQIHGEFIINHNKFLLLDDYGHHPEEIKAVFAAIREGWSNRRIIIVFQPHRYSRTQQLFMDFVNVLSQADRIILLDIYSAGEQEIPNISSDKLSSLINHSHSNKVRVISKQQHSNLEYLLLLELNKIIQDGDILLMQGAGDVGKLTEKLITKLKTSLEEIKV